MRDKKNSEDDKPRFFETIKGFWVFAAVVALLWLINLVVMSVLFEKPEQAGTAGDMFGAATSLFSGLAFAGLLTTLFMQRRELALQRRELELSRDEFRLQRFENTLFALIKLFNDHVDNLKVSESSIVHAYAKILLQDPNTKTLPHSEGKELLALYVDTIWNESRYPDMEDVSIIGQQSFSYENSFYKAFETNLGPYFRLLQNTIEQIDSADLSEIEKQNYAKIVRAYLSSEEIKLLMFHCASAVGREFKPLVIKYRLLKHISSGEVDKNPNIIREYPSEAFENTLPAELFEGSPPSRG